MKNSSQLTSMAPVKNRNNDRKKLCLLYGFTLFALTLSISVGSITKPNQTNALSETIHPVFFINLHSIACMTLIGMSLYFEIHHKETFEKVHQSTGPVPFSVKYSARGEKVNLYLRLGLLMFGFMSLGYVIARMHEGLNWLEYVGCSVEILFFVCQTIFILRYHRIVILHHNTIFGTLLVNLMATNLCTWTDVSVSKIYHLLSKHAKPKNETHVVSNHTVPSSHDEDFNNNIVTYLMPTVSEYSLLAAALLYELTVRIGEPSYIELKELMTGAEIPLLEDYDDVFNTVDQGAITDNRGKEDSQIDNPVDNSVLKKKLHLPKYGPFKSGIGCYTAIGTVGITAAITIVISTSTKGFWMTYVLFLEELLLHTTGVICTILAFSKTRQLKFSIATKQSLVDEFLLYLALFFTANYIISNIINASFTVHIDYSLNGHKKLLLIIRATLDSIEVVQTLLQTYFIQDSFHRCCDQSKHKEEKPGRQLVASLLGINLALWILKSFQMKKCDIFSYFKQELFMSKILIVISLPLNLFYRYHCTVCLSQCFTKLYEEETRRFEEMWRFESGQFTELLTLPTSICPKCNSASYDGGADSPEARPRLLPSKVNFQSGISFNEDDKSKFDMINQEKKERYFAKHESLYRKPTLSPEKKYSEPNETYLSGAHSDLEIPSLLKKKTSFDSLKNRSISKKFLDTPVHKTIKSISAKTDANIFKRGFKKNGENRRRTLRNMETAKYRVLAAELAHQMVVHRANPGPDAGALIKRRFTSAFPEVFKKNSPSASFSNSPECQDTEWLDAIQATAAITAAPALLDANAFSKILHPMQSEDRISPSQKKNSLSFLFSLPEEDHQNHSQSNSSSDHAEKQHPPAKQNIQIISEDSLKNKHSYDLDNRFISSPLAPDASTNSSQTSLEYLKTSGDPIKKHKETKF